MTSWRWPGVVGLNVLSAILISPNSESRGHVDAVTFFEGHHRLLDVRLLAKTALERLVLALADQRVDALDLDVEQLLDRFLDLRLGRGARDLEHDLVALGRVRRLLGDDRREDDVVVARVTGAHLKRASSASTAALVRTSLVRRRMS